ncbi:hypothetical protein DFP72DRAFT_825135, partial [Ephemerocybe angulata]
MHQEYQPYPPYPAPQAQHAHPVYPVNYALPPPPQQAYPGWAPAFQAPGPYPPPGHYPPPVPPQGYYVPQPFPPQHPYVVVKEEKRKPSLDTVRELKGAADFPMWHMEVQRIAVDNGLWPHVAPNPPPGTPYVSGLFPEPMPQHPAQQDAWWKVDGVMSGVLLEKLSPTIRGLAPASSGFQRVTARTIYEWILQQYGLNDYSSFQAMLSEVMRYNCSGKNTVQEFTRKWLERLSTLRTASFHLDERQLLNAFAVGLPATDSNY